MNERQTTTGLPENFAEDAWLALTMMGTFAACDWYEDHMKTPLPPKVGRSG